MWQHRNNTLFNHQKAGDSFKRRKTVIRAVETQIKIEFTPLRMKDKKSICTDLKKLKKWTTPMLEAWLKNINALRERSHRYRHEDVEEDFQIKKDDMYLKREENLNRCSSSTFWRWRMKHHNSTLTQYVLSKLELERQLKRQRN